MQRILTTGHTYRITAKPDAGYVFDSFVITDKNGKNLIDDPDIEYHDEGDDVEGKRNATFKMKSDIANIDAVFTPMEP